MIQDYIRAKWGRPGSALTADELGRKLDPELRKRIDLLGVDDEKLLGISPEKVFSRIEELEREALREDSGVSEHSKSAWTSTKPSPPRRASRSRR
jgi:hypothetical protein